MTEPKILWYWDMDFMRPEGKGFYWHPVNTFDPIYVVKCSSVLTKTHWNVVRVEFEHVDTIDQIQQTMDTLLDVCRMRYADELLNQGEMK